MNESEFMAIGADGVRLACRVFDPPRRGAPGLLLHHGLASSSRIWDLMLPTLTATFRVVAYDARGHGRSGKPTSGYGFDHVTADALLVARAARLPRPLVVGHSWGAMAMLELAAAHPRSIAGAVLVDGGLAGVGEHRDWRTTKEFLAPPQLAGLPVEDFLASIPSRSPVPVTPQIQQLFLSLMHVDRRGRIRPRLSRANHLRILRAIWEQRPLDLYERVRIPVLAIAARSDDPGQRDFVETKRRGMAVARRAARGRPVTFAWMQGVHDLPVQHPAALARRIIRFWEGIVG